MDRAQIGLDVFDYGNFREYLADWLEAARGVDPRVSHRWFAKRLGSANPSVLLNVISGRRSLSDDRVDDYVEVLGLTGVDADYFRALVAFAQAPNRAAADAAFATLAELRTRRRAPGVPGDAFDFLEKPLAGNLSGCRSACEAAKQRLTDHAEIAQEAALPHIA